MGYYGVDQNSNELEHHGVLGQKWGVRRYQNKDGSLTAEGKRRVYAQAADGGYESFRHRHRRAIDAAKYENDIKRNQKKLDRAYEKGNDKKIAKYTEADRMLKNNRDIMVKDLSPEQIQMGRDYLTQMKATAIGTIIAGPIGGAAAGIGVRYANKMPETEKKVYAQEAERRKMFDEETKPIKEAQRDAEKAKRAYIDYQTQDPEEHSNLYSQQLAKDYEAKKQKVIDEKVKLAKKTNHYDMEFLERNLDVDDETGEQLKGKALDDAYRKYLQKENKYYK